MVFGADEAGRGPVIGPMVIGAVSTDEDNWMMDCGINDSKLVAPTRREELDGIIRRRCSHCLLIITPEGIDQGREVMSLNRIEVLGFASVLGSLICGRTITHPHLPPDCSMELNCTGSNCGPAYIDAADVIESRFGFDVSDVLETLYPGSGLEVISNHKADKEKHVVGAASILAKVRRDLEVKNIGIELGSDVGSGYPHDPVTLGFLKEWIRDHGDLPPHTRRSWDTARRMIREKEQVTLMEF
jgi:ribonuclease HII